jgi:hypothetical protein
MKIKQAKNLSMMKLWRIAGMHAANGTIDDFGDYY